MVAPTVRFVGFLRRPVGYPREGLSLAPSEEAGPPRDLSRLDARGRRPARYVGRIDAYGLDAYGP